MLKATARSYYGVPCVTPTPPPPGEDQSPNTYIHEDVRGSSDSPLIAIAIAVPVSCVSLLALLYYFLTRPRNESATAVPVVPALGGDLVR